MGGATLKRDKELMKKGCGAFDYRSAEELITGKWFESKCVNLLSNACGITPLFSVKRWTKQANAKIAILCPSLIPAYNQHMGGINLSDMLVHMYKTPVKSRQWYLPLFGYILDLCISNAWLVYKMKCSLLNEKPLPLKRFLLAAAHTLAQVNKPASKVGRPSSSSPPPSKSKRKLNTPGPNQPQPDVRYDNVGHLPLYSDKWGRCNFCPMGVSRWKCQKCSVCLCLNAKQECFVAYHQKYSASNGQQQEKAK